MYYELIEELLLRGRILKGSKVGPVMFTSTKHTPAFTFAELFTFTKKGNLITIVSQVVQFNFSHHS